MIMQKKMVNWIAIIVGFMLIAPHELHAGKAPPCEDPGVCGPYSQCLEVDNLKRRSEDSMLDEPSPFDWSQSIAKALKKYATWSHKSSVPAGSNSSSSTALRQQSQTVLCACKPHHIGAPPKCRPLSCSQNTDCPNHLACVKGQNLCKDPCQGICGTGAECKVINHFPVCRCLKGFTGDPFFICKPSTCSDNEQCPPELECIESQCRDPCDDVQCGANAKCWVVRHHKTCVCEPGFTGNAFEACAAVVEDQIAARCNLDVDCPTTEACINGYCRDPCVGYCKGLWKKCRVDEHRPRCDCELNTYAADDGNCLLNSGSYCGRDPIRVCGVNSQCIESTIGPVCRCLQGYVGHPPNCRACASAFECGKSDQTCVKGRCVHACSTVHCTGNAVCVMEGDAPTCKCLKGYSGDGFTTCIKDKTPTENLTQCAHEIDCSDKESCINMKCQSPCMGTCGHGAECIIKNHVPSCFCPAGNTGDPYYYCAKLPPTPPFEGDECESDEDCPDDMSCGLHKVCVSPCNHVCALQAKCEAKKHRATCWCPNVGQPWKRCFSSEEHANATTGLSHPGPYSLVNRRQVSPCNPSPCGTMASCIVSRNRAICHCLAGYFGSPPACTPKCFKDHDCPENLACIAGVCAEPCHTKCSRNEYTFCTVIKHKPTCVDATNSNLLLRLAPGYQRG